MPGEPAEHQGCYHQETQEALQIPQHHKVEAEVQEVLGRLGNQVALEVQEQLEHQDRRHQVELEVAAGLEH